MNTSKKSTIIAGILLLLSAVTLIALIYFTFNGITSGFQPIHFIVIFSIIGLYLLVFIFLSLNYKRGLKKIPREAILVSTENKEKAKHLLNQLNERTVLPFPIYAQDFYKSALKRISDGYKLINVEKETYDLFEKDLNKTDDALLKQIYELLVLNSIEKKANK